MVVDVLRKLIGGFRGVGDGWAEAPGAAPTGYPDYYSLELDYDEIISRLQLAKMEIDRLKYQIINEIDKLNTKLIEAARRRNMESMEEYAAEIVLKKKVLRSIIMFQKLINMAIVRINDARNIEALAKSMAVLEYAMKATNEFLYTASPEIVSTLNTVKESTERLIRGTSMLAENLPRGRIEIGIDEEVKREIARALREAQVESDKLIPNIPIQGVAKEKIKKRDLEKELLDYIKKNNGVLNLKKAAEDLDASIEEIKKALYRLQQKGIIKVSKGGAYRQEA